ncbi:PREDICTED: uncharacterized protein LOC105557453 [Vollenhovia emeryi]|uniref:uncharacterized protein LOC105557453 n=1 Tax=Vollenhovia emeryi TaxID=411798 RepID=UPI0005F450E6|nr:PREDICTED: uncharacterized protein LOC105557453 [Vollenhovia emeryi]
MGRHKARREAHRSRSKRRRSRSPSSSSEDAKKQRDDRFERLEHIVESLDRRSTAHTRGSCIHRGDELMIPLFDPSKDELVVDKWIEHVDDLAAQYDWDEKAIMRLIPGRLVGHARQWYDTRPRLAVTWNEIKNSLKQQFRKSVPFCKLFKEAALYESVPGQALGDYCFQTLRKMRKLDITIPDKYIIDAVIGGITDENVARTVRSAQHSDANELYAYMTTLDSLPTKTERNKAATNTKSERKDRVSPIDEARVVNTSDSTPSTGDKAKTKIECFNCGKAGHIARKCRMPRIECERCNRLGHQTEKCPLKTDVNIVEKIANGRNSYGRLVVVNGHKLRGLVDTGSGCTLIRAAVAEKYDMAITITSDNVLRGFAGQIATSNRSMRCEVRIMDAVAQVNVVIVSDNYFIYDVIVGRDFLEQEHIVVIKRGKALIFKQLPAIDDEIDNSIEVNCLSTRKEDEITISIGAIGDSARQ